MKNSNYYWKHRVQYPRAIPSFFEIKPWQLFINTFAIALAEPLLVYKYYRHSIPFTWSFYWHQLSLFLILIFVIGFYQIWISRKNLIKLRRGYCWLGKFEVTAKEKFIVCYLTLTPGEHNKIRVTRKFYNEIKTGDVILVRKDIWGVTEEVTKLKKFSTHLARTRSPSHS